MCKSFGMICILLITVFLTGCSSAGMMTARHNGKMYWNPGNCSSFTYSYSNPDVLKCSENGVATGFNLYPADQQQINNYRYQEENTQSALDGLNNSIDKYNRNQVDRANQLRSLQRY